MPIQIGDIVTCKISVEAYNYWFYKRQYGKEVLFNPGMQGVVKSVAPKVRIVKDGARTDGKDTFLVVDFESEEGKTERVGLNWCNVVKVRPLQSSTEPKRESATPQPGNGLSIQERHTVTCKR